PGSGRHAGAHRGTPEPRTGAHYRQRSGAQATGAAIFHARAVEPAGAHRADPDGKGALGRGDWPAEPVAGLIGRSGCAPGPPVAGLSVPALGAWGCWPGVVPASIAAWADARLRATCSKKPS